MELYIICPKGKCTPMVNIENTALISVPYDVKGYITI